MNPITDNKTLKLSSEQQVAQTISNLRSIDKIEESQDTKDIDFKLGVKRILTILDSCIEKTIVAFCLPTIIDENPELIESKSNELETFQIVSSFKRLEDVLQSVSFVTHFTVIFNYN